MNPEGWSTHPVAVLAVVVVILPVVVGSRRVSELIVVLIAQQMDAQAQVAGKTQKHRVLWKMEISFIAYEHLKVKTLHERRIGENSL